MHAARPMIAYLAPELPALSATFVYEELLAIERRGFRVLPVSVHRPEAPAIGQEALAQRTAVLYGDSRLAQVRDGLRLLPKFGVRTWAALRCLLADMVEVGPLRLQAWKLVVQFCAGARLADLLVVNRCAHLHIHFVHVPAQIGMYASLLSQVPFTVTAHANDIFQRGLLLRRKAERSRKLLTISNFNRLSLIGLGVPAERIAIVRCGVHLKAAQSLAGATGMAGATGATGIAGAAETASPTGARRDGRDGRTVRIGTLGRLVEKKGMDVLVGALAELVRDGRNVALEIAGDGPLRAALEAQVARHGLAAHVSFVGSLAHEAVAAWMRTLDVFALACKPDGAGDMDGIPVVLMEAMSLRVAVVSTRLSGIPELVEHERTGLLAFADNALDLASQLSRLIAQPELRARLADAAARHVAGEFSAEANVDRLLAFFDLPAATTSAFRTARFGNREAIEAGSPR